MKGSELNRDEYRQCVMDTSDPMIRLIRVECATIAMNLKNLPEEMVPDEKGEAHKAVMLEKSRHREEARITTHSWTSGGLDSSHLLCVRWKLRLVVQWMPLGIVGLLSPTSRHRKALRI